MQKHLKIILIAVLGIFFSVATLEIDAFGYDNTFFDTYDSYLHVDNQVLQHHTQIEHGCIDCPEIIRSPNSPFIKSASRNDAYFLSSRLQKRKLYLSKSSLLI